MKKVIFVLIAMAVAVNANAQNAGSDTIPTAIRNAIITSFANADAVEWIVSDSIYTGTFTLDGKRHIIDLTASGKTLRHRYKMSEGKYPKAITALVKNDYPAYRIEDIDYIEVNGAVTYEAELEGKPDMVLTFDSTGKLLSSKKE